MKPTTAVIFAAGTGTRMLPITAAVQKELLPIGNRPVIDYVVSDLVAAGINRIIFVTRAGTHGLQDYYMGNDSLKRALERLGKTQALAQLESIHQQATFEFVEQPESAGYGTAIPLQVALPLLSTDEAVIACGGDDFVWHSDGSSEMTRFIETFEASGGEGAIMSLEMDPSRLHDYGVLSTRKASGHEYLTDIIEKPTPDKAPSNLINVSKYILSPSLHQYVNAIKPRHKPAESYLTDAITAAIRDGHHIVVHQALGQYLDTGNPASWLHANNTVAATKPPR